MASYDEEAKMPIIATSKLNQIKSPIAPITVVSIDRSEEEYIWTEIEGIPKLCEAEVPERYARHGEQSYLSLQVIHTAGRKWSLF